ncbi:L-rhamnose mutarotase [Actinomycetota bacterium]
MQRVGFRMKIKPELKDEYKKAHDEIWPELAKAINDYGMHNYSIYFGKDGTLFAFLEVEGDFVKQMEEFSKLDVSKRWQKYMDRYFVKEDKSIIGAEVEMLEEVFHLD